MFVNLRYIFIPDMKSAILALFAITIIIVILMPEESNGSPARFRNRSQRLGRRGRARAAFRRGRGSFRGANRRRNFGFQSRKGRTFTTQEIPPPQEDDVNQVQSDYDTSGDEEGSGVAETPHWCNPSHNMGSWMNFLKLRKWCSNNGYSNFGPYGGVPAAASGDPSGSIDRADVDIDGNDVGGEGIDDEYEY